MTDFVPFPKIARLSREITITEKVDGTNAAVQIVDHHESATPGYLMSAPNAVTVVDGRFAVYAQSRTRLITPDDDNFGFAAWVRANAEDLANLGPGTHFGEWWGSGIQRRYGLTNGERRFSLFNVGRWTKRLDDPSAPYPEGRALAPACCHVVPTLYQGVFDQEQIEHVLSVLRGGGSRAAPGFMNPEGIIIWHEAGRCYFKKTLDRDDEWKGKAAA